jgi:folate-binding protein YgfZ
VEEQVSKAATKASGQEGAAASVNSSTGASGAAGSGASRPSSEESVGALAAGLAASLGAAAEPGSAVASIGGAAEGDGNAATAAAIGLSGYGPQIVFEGEASAGEFLSGVTPLLEYGLLKVHGADAEGFLQGQLTNDVTGLAEGQVRLAGYCSVKGRLLASFWIWRAEAEPAFWLACSRDLAAPIARRLSMFVLRSKVKVENHSDSTMLLGLIRAGDASDGSPDLAGALQLPTLVLPVTLAAALNPALLETSAELRVERALRPVEAGSLERTLSQMKEAGVRLLSTPAWRRLEVLSGIARINAANQELFVPQMVNFELVEGVSFRKGCYPGQEVVARSQYLGKLKRRMFLGLGSGAVPLPGVDVSRLSGGEPVGQVVLAAPLSDGRRFVVLYESSTASAGEGDDPQAPVLHVGATALSRLPLPYPIPAAASRTAPTGARAVAPDGAA